MPVTEEKMKQPLTLYVLWHPGFKDGEKYANAIFTTFSRDVKEPLTRGIGIPVYFRTGTVERNIPLPIDVEKSERTAVVALIDAKFVINEEWTSYLNDLNDKISPPHILYPVAVTSSAFNLEGDVPKINFIRLYGIEESGKVGHLLMELSQELCRLLYDRKRLADRKSESLSQAPIKIFLSHSKHDEDKGTLALKLKDYVQQKLSVDTFFDARDIANGFKFPAEINGNIKESVLLVLHTDSYSTREWCRKEVIKAKKYSSPVVVINAFKKGEKRSFPYMANVPNIKWDLGSAESMDIVFDKLFFQVLTESLRFRFHRENIKYLLSIFEVELEDRNILANPPELLTFLRIKNLDKKIVVYPDPPLGDVESELLNEFEPGIRFITPTVLPLLTSAHQKFLSGIRVGVSISQYPDSYIYGFKLVHFQDALVECARYLLMCGAAVAYGGNIRYDKDLNFATLLFDLLRTYSDEQKETPEKIRNYVAYPISETITDEERANLIKTTEFIEIKPPKGLQIEESVENILKGESVESKYVWARCLTLMREEMNRNTDARIFLGGKTLNFKGKYPGLLEEAYLALKDQKPVYLIGAFGGCTRAIIDALKGKSPEEFTEKYQSQAPGYTDFVEYFNSEIINVEGGEPVNFPKLLNFFNKKTIEDLNNGLTPEENQKLFETVSVPEMIGLVLKGLKNRFKP
jgi:hypothetical protein